MSQLDIPSQESIREIKRSPTVSIPREALELITDEWKGHIDDVREHNRTAVEGKRGAAKLYHRAKSIGYAALYTGYFWFDDFPARGLTKLAPNRMSELLLVGGASLGVGGAIAFTRRRQLKKMYHRLGHDMSEVGPSIKQMANASILGAPNTVKATAQDGPINERHIMSTGAVLASAATYAGLQSITAGPVIDAIDHFLPGGHLGGEIAATATFVLGAMYMKSLVEVGVQRFRN